MWYFISTTYGLGKGSSGMSYSLSFLPLQVGDNTTPRRVSLSVDGLTDFAENLLTPSHRGYNLDPGRVTEASGSKIAETHHNLMPATRPWKSLVNTMDSAEIVR